MKYNSIYPINDIENNNNNNYDNYYCYIENCPTIGFYKCIICKKNICIKHSIFLYKKESNNEQIYCCKLCNIDNINLVNVYNEIMIETNKQYSKHILKRKCIKFISFEWLTSHFRKH